MTLAELLEQVKQQEKDVNPAGTSSHYRWTAAASMLSSNLELCMHPLQLLRSRELRAPKNYNPDWQPAHFRWICSDAANNSPTIRCLEPSHSACHLSENWIHNCNYSFAAHHEGRSGSQNSQTEQAILSSWPCTSAGFQLLQFVYNELSNVIGLFTGVLTAAVFDLLMVTLI